MTSEKFWAVVRAVCAGLRSECRARGDGQEGRRIAPIRWREKIKCLSGVVENAPLGYLAYHRLCPDCARAIPSRPTPAHVEVPLIPVGMGLRWPEMGWHHPPRFFEA
jgi:hypothetical protein